MLTTNQTTTGADSIAPSSTTPFAGTVNTEHWNGIMGPPGFEPKDDYLAQYLELAQAIKRAAPMLIGANAGIKMCAPGSVVTELTRSEQDFKFEIDDAFVKDCLGKHGLCLPFISIGKNTYYALHLVDATPHEKALFQVQLNDLTSQERARLLVVQ